MNNSSNNSVWQIGYDGTNGAIHLLIEIVVVELFKCKGKMSPLPGGNLQITSWRGEHVPMVETSNSL